MNEAPNLYDEPNRRANVVVYALHWELATAFLGCDEADQELFCQEWAWKAHISGTDFARWTKGIALPSADCERKVAAEETMRMRIREMKFGEAPSGF